MSNVLEPIIFFLKPGEVVSKQKILDAKKERLRWAFGDDFDGLFEEAKEFFRLNQTWRKNVR